MKRKTTVIPKSEWPDSFKELETIHFHINSYFSFLCSRKHIITTFDILKPSAETAIGRALTHLDVAKICRLLPDETFFNYVDENQIIIEEERTRQKESDIFELEGPTQSAQLLLFEFLDGNPRKTGPLYRGPVKLPTYKPESIKRLIVKRNEKFAIAVSNFLQECISEGLDADDELERESVIPSPMVYEDPMEALLRKGETSSTEERITIPQVIEKLKQCTLYRDQIKAEYTEPTKAAEFSLLEENLHPFLLQGLQDWKGIIDLYTHQSQALNALQRGKNVIVSTSTSSGKSLIYQLPILNEILKDSNATGIFVFPTKALAQDQKRAINELIAVIPELDILADTYDGDTRKEDRNYIRNRASIIFTNPDMLHSSILPNHEMWDRFLRNLKLVVVDELHMYCGVFGAHMAYVMRRLQRLIPNNETQYISCSATLPNPKSHMHSIFGLEADLIEHICEDGSPRGTRHLVVWNPPLKDAHDPKEGRESFIVETAKLVVELLQENVRTIVFCMVRRVVELLMREIRHMLKLISREDLLSDVMSYRGGYSLQDRRAIESQMFSGNLKVVISTNALELGIDIGVLDCVLVCGFPLSLANFHQQSGRAGRRSKDSLTLFVGGDDPVNQHYMANPDKLLSVEYQDIYLDLHNLVVAEPQLQCAAFEKPFSKDEAALFLEGILDCEGAIAKLFNQEGMYFVSRHLLPWPSSHVSLRSVEEDVYAVVDITNDRNVVIEEVEASRTSFTLYDGGIFIHQGLPYLVKEFNPDGKYAKVVRVNVDWITSQRDFTDVDPKQIQKVRSLWGSDVPVYFGDIQTTIIVFGFFKIDRHKRILDAVEVHNPPVIMQSKGMWIDIPRKAIEIVSFKRLHMAAGIHAAQHAIINVLPLFIMSTIDEIQTECKAAEKEFAKRQTKRKRAARLVFYDSQGGPGGSGLSLKILGKADDILAMALEKTLSCECEIGCPLCCAGSYCKENSLVISKVACVIILGVILGKEIDIDSIPMGPEPNLPEDITIETIEFSNAPVKFSKDIEILDIQPTAPLSEPISKDEELAIVRVRGLDKMKGNIKGGIKGQIKEEDVGNSELPVGNH